MIISASNLQFFVEYSQQDREQSLSTMAVNNQSPFTTNAEPQKNTGSLTQFDANERVALNSSQSVNTYSKSILKANEQETATQLTTQNAVSSILSRFYSNRIRLTQLELSPRLAQQSGVAANGNLNSGEQPITPNNFAISSGSYYEYQSNQQLTFVAKGEIHTTEGESIQFEFYATAKQNFQYQQGSGSYAARVTQRTDPLIINLSGNYNNLTDSTFSFDLDSDGETEELSFAGQGSGFLVIDKNNDGKINNGSEMFGPKTGNGFNELAEYDEDGNGFIDAGDSAYDQLKVWTKDSDGKDQLLSLKEADVAAIGVASGFSPFQIKDNYNNEYGEAQRTGIFISESGDVGSVQQINLTHRDLEAEQALKEEFDEGEIREQQRQQSEQQNQTLEIDSNNLQSIEQAMQRLNSMTEAMLKRQDELAEMQKDSKTKSLIEQIVEKLEEARLQQQKEQQEAQQKTDQSGL